MEDAVDNLLMNFIRLSRIKQCIVDVSRPIIKCRKQKPEFWSRHNLTCTAMKFVVSREKAKFHFSFLHGANAANDIGEYRIGGLSIYLIVFILVRHIVSIMCQQDKVIAIAEIK